MPPSPPYDIMGLFWPVGREDHVEEHISAWEVEELIEGGDFFAFPNTRGHPPKRWLVVGKTESGWWVTAVLQEPADGDPWSWEPVTGWRSDEQERKMYQQEKDRGRSKRGR